ncbi:MAG TPA: toxin-antitoxin system YwqK family antitoxin [Verrucomicrobiae bacterium]|nr:toxin-antitoxin system YwqK family antitoxin [Verrucomicrobiae bacterium]
MSVCPVPREKSNFASWLKWILVAIILAVIADIFLTRRPPPAKPVSWPTVSRTNLVLRDGQWFPLRGTNTFTGWMVDFYPDGLRRSRSAISNGLLNGICEGWYTNGQLQIREHFVNSVSDGLREKWFENGQLESKAIIVNGKIEGVFRRWYENGQLAEQIEMKNGQPDGSALAFYPSGFAKAKTRASAGRVLDQQVWKDGEHKISN